MRQAHYHSTRALGALILLLGLTLVVTTVARGGGPLSIGVIMGIVFTALGAARLYLSVALRDER